MERKSTILFLALIISFILAGAQSTPTEITAFYGPPVLANTWEKYTIPLTAETFNVDETTFNAVLSNITSFWIRTEMHTGYDIGGIDDVNIGGTYVSHFYSSNEGWSSGGDGTMEWIWTGGVEGGFLQISDWASGDWHWLIAPITWSGDWSSLNGQNIEFWYKTDQPSYEAVIKLTSGVVNRLAITPSGGTAIQTNDSLFIHLEVVPTPTEDLTVMFYTSDYYCIRVPDPVTIPAGSSGVWVYFTAADDAVSGCTSVIEATSSGYLTSRITLTVLDNAGISEPEQEPELSVFPNPCKGKFNVSSISGKNIDRIIVCGLQGNTILDLEINDNNNTQIDVSGQPRGIYFLKVFVDGKILTSKIILE